MSEREFCYWLQGFFEIEDPASLSPTQVKIIKDHLALVFHKVTPNRQTVGPEFKIPIMSDISWSKDLLIWNDPRFASC